jgi:hypothetical protein
VLCRPETSKDDGELLHLLLRQRRAEAMLKLVVEGGSGLGEKGPARCRQPGSLSIRSPARMSWWRAERGVVS